MNAKHNDHRDHAGDKPDVQNTETQDQEVIDEPVLAGSEDHSEDDIDPRKGMSDPALIRDIEEGRRTLNPYG